MKDKDTHADYLFFLWGRPRLPDFGASEVSPICFLNRGKSLSFNCIYTIQYLHQVLTLVYNDLLSNTGHLHITVYLPYKYEVYEVKRSPSVVQDVGD